MKMIIPKDVKCKICGKVFCCPKCRQKHENITHEGNIIYPSPDEKQKQQPPTPQQIILCPICENQPLPLRQQMPEDLINHISHQHLPLQCKKCFKIYDNITNLLTFTNCKKINLTTKETHDLCSYVSPPQSSSSPQQEQQQQQEQMHDDHLTPLSVWNLRWKIKSKSFDGGSSAGDNTSSPALRNINSKNPDLKGKLVRTTSTPMQKLISQTKENNNGSLNNYSSSCHVSSINSLSSESDISPPMRNFLLPLTPSSLRPKPSSASNNNIDIRKRGRKIPVSATPLRQVMSKSIQRAIAEHVNGIQSQYSEPGIHPKKIFDSIEKHATLSSPIDLRTSPVRRRSQPETSKCSTFEDFGFNGTKSYGILSSTKHTKHIEPNPSCSSQPNPSSSSNNNISEKLDTVYETCQSIENGSCKQEIIEEESKIKSENQLTVTPKLLGGNLKKTISFETPNSQSKQFNTDNNNKNHNNSTSDDIFFTPQQIPLRSYNSLPSMDSSGKSTLNPFQTTVKYPHLSRNNNNINQKYSSVESLEDDVFEIPKDIKTSKQNDNKKGVWSFMTSVMRLATFVRNDPKKKVDEPPVNRVKTTDPSLIKRCASFAGILSRNRTSEEDMCSQPIKRRRTNTDSHLIPSSLNSELNGYDISAVSKRIKRIQGRQPIERMRNLS